MRATMLLAFVFSFTMLFAAERQNGGQDVSLQLFIPAAATPPYSAYPLVLTITNRYKETLDFSRPMLCMEEHELRTKPLPDGVQLVLTFEPAAERIPGAMGTSMRIPPYKAVQIASGETGLVMNHIPPQIILRSGNRVRVVVLRDGKVLGSTDWTPVSLDKRQ